MTGRQPGSPSRLVALLGGQAVVLFASAPMNSLVWYLAGAHPISENEANQQDLRPHPTGRCLHRSDLRLGILAWHGFPTRAGAEAFLQAFMQEGAGECGLTLADGPERSL